MPTYATPDDLAAWTGASAPANAVQLLRTASGLVAEATITAWYATDSAGLPTATATLDAFRDATCAHAAAMAAAKVDPAAGAAVGAGAAVRKKVGTAEVEYAGAADAASARARLVDVLCPEAIRILRAAGLTPSVLG
ncbi:hypothetical protein [Intrasporangium flavum]|uniref:hypothetical protein n=1 Tax=Intrasporangium flavum TaxID=1428657 RepID=UPI00096F585B|nr:hypothetical protein [Intrasporangium flavum]